MSKDQNDSWSFGCSLLAVALVSLALWAFVVFLFYTAS